MLGQQRYTAFERGGNNGAANVTHLFTHQHKQSAKMTIQELYDNPHLILLDTEAAGHAYGTICRPPTWIPAESFFLPKAQFWLTKLYATNQR